MRLLRLYLPLLLILGIFWLVVLIGIRQHSQAWYFQDETEHVTLGWMLTDYGRQLYTTLSTNHQPLPILVGAVLVKIIPYGTFFEFIDRLRMSLWLFGALASIAIVIRFKVKGLLAVLLTYSLGHYYFAWYVLAESLVIPAVLWQLLNLEERLFNKHIGYDFDGFCFGLTSFWLVFNLVPLWPFVLLANGIYWWLSRWSAWKLLIIGFLVPTLSLFLVIKPWDWWQETVINNVIYFIPSEAPHDAGHYLRLVFYPVLHLPYLSSVVARFFSSLVLLFLISVVVFRSRFSWAIKNHRLLISLGLFYALSLLLNPRVSQLNVSFFSGFHVFPYVAGLSVVASSLSLRLFQHFWHRPQTRPVAYLVTVGLALLLLSNLSWVGEKKDKLTDYYIQYDTFSAYGTALKAIAQPGDTLMTGPDGAGYMNQMANLPLAGRQNFHLDWAYRVPYLRTAWLDMIEHQPPTFVYFNLSQDNYSQTLGPLLARDYVTLQRADGSPTQLRMRRSAVNQVSEHQWQQFEDQQFLRPSLN